MNDHDYSGERRRYLEGFAFALGLTLIPFAHVAWDVVSRGVVLGTLGI